MKMWGNMHRVVLAQRSAIQFGCGGGSTKKGQHGGGPEITIQDRDSTVLAPYWIRISTGPEQGPEAQTSYIEWPGEHIGRQRDSEQSKHHSQKSERHPRESGSNQEESGGTGTDIVESERDSDQPEGNPGQSESDSGRSKTIGVVVPEVRRCAGFLTLGVFGPCAARREAKPTLPYKGCAPRHDRRMESPLGTLCSNGNKRPCVDQSTSGWNHAGICSKLR